MQEEIIMKKCKFCKNKFLATKPSFLYCPGDKCRKAYKKMRAKELYLENGPRNITRYSNEPKKCECGPHGRILQRDLDKYDVKGFINCGKCGKSF